MSPADWTSWTNAQWITGLRRDAPDEAVQAALIEFMRQQALLLARRRGMPDAEATAQEATFAAYRKVTEKLAQFRNQGPFLGWVRRIVQNEVSNEARRDRAARLAMPATDADAPGVQLADLAAQAAFEAVEADPDDPAGLSAERTAALQRCLEQLLPLERASLHAWADVYPLLMAAEHYYRLRWAKEQAQARSEAREPNAQYAPPKKIDLSERSERYAAVAEEFEVKSEAVHTYAKNARKKMLRCLGA